MESGWVMKRRTGLFKQMSKATEQQELGRELLWRLLVMVVADGVVGVVRFESNSLHLNAVGV